MWHFALFITTALAIHDVCIIGGGSSGTYAAVQLHDLGYKVALIEREAQLGGHTNTYLSDDLAIDYGVVDFRKNISVVEEYFSRLGITYDDFNGAVPSIIRANLQTGQIQTNSTLPGSQIDSLQRYARIAGKYPGLEYGFYLPDPVPEELLLPFEKFAVKYNITNIMPVVYKGYGNVLTQPSLYVMKYFGPNAVGNLLQGFYSTTSRNNSEIYTRAGDIVGDNILLNSEVVSAKRPGNGTVEVTVQTPSGQKVIQARKLLITIPPMLSIMNAFDLNGSERELFAQFQSVGYYTSLVTGTGIPVNTTLKSVDISQPYYLPTLPGLYSVSNTESTEIYQAEYGSASPLSNDAVKEDILRTIDQLKTTGISNGTVNPGFVVYRSHSPYMLTVPVDAIRDGFYKKLYALQGYRNTFYTGAAFHAHDSSLLWRFTKSLIPKILQDL